MDSKICKYLIAIVNVFNYEKKGSYFSMKIPFTLYHIRKITSFWIFVFRYTVILQSLFQFRRRRRLFSLNGILFTQEIPNEIILLCIDYHVGKKKLKLERNKCVHSETFKF